MLTAAGEKLRTRHLRSESASSPRVFGNFRVDQQVALRRAIVLTRANSALKLTVRRCFSRRPSRLPCLEFARRRATCTGNIVCAASGAPLDAGRLPAARNLTSDVGLTSSHAFSVQQLLCAATRYAKLFVKGAVVGT